MSDGTRSRCSPFLFALLASLLLDPRPASADDEARTRENPYRAGSSALEFAIGNDFTLSSFSGATLSYRRHTSDRAAWRIGFTVNARSGDSDRETVSPDTVAFPTVSQDREFGSLALTLTAQRLWFAGGTTPVHVYFGLGPSVGVFRDDSDVSSETQYPDTTIVDSAHSERRDWSVGLAGVLGVEWFMTPYLSLVADYGASIDWQSFDRTTTLTNSSLSRQDEEDGHVFGLNSNGFHFGVAAWFK